MTPFNRGRLTFRDEEDEEGLEGVLASTAEAKWFSGREAAGELEEDTEEGSSNAVRQTGHLKGAASVSI